MTDYHSSWFECTPTQICNEEKVYYNKFWSQAYCEIQTDVSVIKSSYIPGNVSMNYELHDWQIFPERTQILGECIHPCSVCVATINVNGVKYVLVCTNGCKIDVAIASWKKKIHSTAQHYRWKKRTYLLEEVAHCETVIKYNMFQIGLLRKIRFS